MKNIILIMCFGTSIAAISLAEPNVRDSGQAVSAVRFVMVDVMLDPGGLPLAAYQIELTASEPEVKIVGVEGGDHAAFAEPPYYDPAALSDHRIIIAAFNTDPDVPQMRTRVASVHLQVPVDYPPDYDAQLVVAAGPEGERIEAILDIELRTEPGHPGAE